VETLVPKKRKPGGRAQRPTISEKNTNQGQKSQNSVLVGAPKKKEGCAPGARKKEGGLIPDAWDSEGGADDSGKGGKARFERGKPKGPHIRTKDRVFPERKVNQPEKHGPVTKKRVSLPMPVPTP